MYFLENGFGFWFSWVIYINCLESSFNRVFEGIYDFENIVEKVDVMYFCGIFLVMNDFVWFYMKLFVKVVKECGGMVVFDCNYCLFLWGDGGYESVKFYYEDMLYFVDIVMMNE